MGTHVLLECCRMYGGIRRFVHVSTDEVRRVASLRLRILLDSALYLLMIMLFVVNERTKYCTPGKGVPSEFEIHQ